MRRTWLAVVVGAVLGIALASDPASATLTLRSGFQNSALSVDGFGGVSGFLQVDTPAGLGMILGIDADIFRSQIAAIAAELGPAQVQVHGNLDYLSGHNLG